MNEHRPEFEERFSETVDEARGLLKMLQSVKSRLPQHAKSDPLYRMTLKRLRDDGIRLAAFSEAYSILFSPAERDRFLGSLACSWDEKRKRVDLG